MIGDIALINEKFVENLIGKIGNDIQNYMFKIERVGGYMTTQDCKPFLDGCYKQVDYVSEFILWIRSQPLIFQKYGSCEEITEIWYRKDESNGDAIQPRYILLWSKENGWLVHDAD